MQEDFLQRFAQWAQVHGELTWSKESRNPSVRLDMGTESKVGRITYWLSGFCDAEVLLTDSEEVVYYNHWDLLMPKDFEVDFKIFINNMRSN